MRDYAKVSPRFWTGDTGLKLREAGQETQFIALYLVTCPSANMIGLYYLPLPTLCHETGIPFEGALKGLRRVSEAGFAHYHKPTEHIWVPEMAAQQIGETLSTKDNRWKSVVREWQALRKSNYYLDFYERYREPFKLPDPISLQAPSKPLRSQEQEQEHELEKEQEHEQTQGALPPEPPGARNTPDKPFSSKNGKAPSSRSKGPDRSVEILQVYAHYQKLHPRFQPKPDGESKEWKKVRARLEEGYSVADLCAAVDGCHRSPFHLGENDNGQQHLGLLVILRDSSQVAKFMDMPFDAPVLSEKTRRTIRAGNQWEDEQWEPGGLFANGQD